MKRQTGIIFSLVFALIIAIFSVVNVDPVKVNYVFGTAKWPLILVILSSVLMGALLVGSFGLVRMYRLQRMVTRLQRELDTYKNDETEAANDIQKSEERRMDPPDDLNSLDKPSHDKEVEDLQK